MLLGVHMSSQWMEQSVEQGLEHLKTEKDKVVFDIASGGCFASPQTQAAVRLHRAMDEGINHSGESFWFALVRTLRLAQRELGARVIYTDSKGVSLPADPKDLTVPAGTKHIALNLQ